MCNRQSSLQYLLPVLLSILCFPTATPAAVVIDEIVADPPPGITGDDGRIGNGLTNSGDVLLLLNAAGDTVDTA